MPTLNDVLAGSQAQAVQVQQIIDALKGTPNKGVPVALVSLNDPNNYALTVQNDDPVNSRALSVLKADGTTLISADATGVTLGAPINVPVGSLNGTQLANASVSNAKLGSDTARANLLTNGGFEIWQRGNGPFTAAGAWGADGWANSIDGTDTLSVSRNTATVDTGSGASAALTFSKGNGVNLQQFRSLHYTGGEWPQLKGRTITLSMRVNTATANAVRVSLDNFYSSTDHVTYSAYHTGGSTWQTLSATITVDPTFAYVMPGISIAASCTAYIDNAMLVVGSQYADYAPLHPADDLARCLRYFELVGIDSEWIISGYHSAGGVLIQGVPLKAQKPIAPTTTRSGTFGLVNASGQPAVDVNGRWGFRTTLTLTALGYGYATSGASAWWIVEANP